MKRRRALRKAVRECDNCYKSSMRGVELELDDGSILTGTGQVVCKEHANGKTHLAILTFRNPPHNERHKSSGYNWDKGMSK